jgi:hypothetical protein
MSAPEPLRDYLDSARNTLGRASWIDGDALTHNAGVFLSSGRVLVARSPEADEAYEECVERIRTLREELSRRAFQSDAQNEQLESARQNALEAIDRLESIWDEADLSDEARALGYGPP